MKKLLVPVVLVFSLLLSTGLAIAAPTSPNAAELQAEYEKRTQELRENYEKSVQQNQEKHQQTLQEIQKIKAENENKQKSQDITQKINTQQKDIEQHIKDLEENINARKGAANSSQDDSNYTYYVKHRDEDPDYVFAHSTMPKVVLGAGLVVIVVVLLYTYLRSKNGLNTQRILSAKKERGQSNFTENATQQFQAHSDEHQRQVAENNRQIAESNRQMEDLHDPYKTPGNDAVVDHDYHGRNNGMFGGSDHGSGGFGNNDHGGSFGSGGGFGNNDQGGGFGNGGFGGGMNGM